MTSPPLERVSEVHAGTDARGPLYYSVFRAIWLAAIFSNLGTWVQHIGESWLMLSLTKSPVPVAMLTTMLTIPACTLILPAGILADRFDRRRLLVATQWWAAFVAFALAITTYMGHATPGVLLAASAALGIGQALMIPAWQSLLPELVVREQMMEAVTLNSVAYNLARTVGPAIGGLLLARFSPVVAFAFNGFSFFAVIVVLQRYEHIRRVSARRRYRAPESMKAAFASFGYALRSPHLRALNVTCGVFGFAAAGVTPILPVFARDVLHTDARGYGLMVTAIGAGAVALAILLPRIRVGISPRATIVAGIATFGVAALALSTTHSLGFALVLLMAAGAGWIATFTTLNSLVQLTAPPHLKSRMLAVYQMTFNAAWALGAAMAGALAERIGVPLTVAIAGALVMCAAWFAASLRFPTYEEGLGRVDLASMPPASR